MDILIGECTKSHLPNAETKKAMENIAKGKNLIKPKSREDLYKKLGI